MTGYVKLYRTLLDSPMMRNRNLLQFFVWCLLRASHKPTLATIGVERVKLERGQLVFGRKAAARELGLSEQQIRTSIKVCVEVERNLTIQTTNRYSVITVVNYDKYQSADSENNQPNNQETTSQQPANNQPITTYKKTKNTKNTEIPPYPPSFGAAFQEAWSEWLTYRAQINRALKPMTQAAQIKRLSQFDEATAVAMIRQSIANGWQGIFEVKDGRQATATGSGKQQGQGGFGGATVSAGRSFGRGERASAFVEPGPDDCPSDIQPSGHTPEIPFL